jgi:WXG100 family type VII secretion target
MDREDDGLMANIHVDYGQLQAGAAQLKSGREQVEQQLSRLKAMIDNLVAGGFVTDRASGKFQESYTQWTTGARNVIAGLDGMSDYLSKAVQAHQGLDDSLAQSAG